MLSAAPQEHGNALEAGISSFNRGDYGAARKLLEPLATHPGPDARPLYYLGRTLCALGEWALASDALERAVAIQPGDAAAHLWLARSYSGEMRKTMNGFKFLMLGWKIGPEIQKSLRLDPGNLDARMDLIRYYVSTSAILGGSRGKALREVEALGARDPAYGRFARGFVEFRLTNYPAAEREFESAAAAPAGGTATANGVRRLALTWLGYLCQQTEQYGKAFAAFEALDGLGDATAKYEIGRTAAFSGLQLERGQHCLEAYLETHPRAEEPSLAAAHFQLGAIAERRGSRDEAHREYATARRLDPDLNGVKAALARTKS